MPEECTIPGLVELEALYRTALPDGTDVAHVAHDDAAWAALSQASAALYAPDFVYEDSVMPDHHGETYRGFEGYRRAVATFTEPFEEMIYALERIVGAGDRVVAIYRVRATARHTGLRFDQQAAYVLSFRGGMISHVRAYLDPDEALNAVGMPETPQRDEPKQTTPAGHEIPTPTRDDFEGMVRKVAPPPRSRKRPDETDEPPERSEQ